MEKVIFMIRGLLTGFFFNLFYTTTSGQNLVYISAYKHGYDEKYAREDFKMDNKKFSYDQNNALYVNDSLIGSISKDSVFVSEVYKDRYLFLSIYKRESSPISIAPWLKPKQKVIVYDLKNPERKWNFDFLYYTSSDLRWFSPKKGRIKLIRKDIVTSE